MGSAEPPPTHGLIRFTIPDKTIPPEQRAFFAQSPASKSTLLSLPLHDFRTSQHITPGPSGLDVQGFTYNPHTFSLSDSELFEGRNAEDIYAKECVDLVCNLTGAKRGVVHNIDIRQKPGRVGCEEEDGLGKVELRGGEVDREVGKFPVDGVFVGGKAPNSGQEPSRMAHVDLTVDGLRETLRYARRDMHEMAQPIFEAEARKAAGEKDIKVPRFAAYSVWRPLFSPVKRDPLAVLDARTLSPHDLTKVYLRLPSQLSSTGDYILEQWRGLPPQHPEQQKWYWVPEQKPEEVLVIKFCDSKSEEDERVAGQCLHISPILEGAEGEEVRRSVECRVYVFWD